MSLFFKHLIRSIKKRPTQPLVLALTLTLSVVVSILSLTMNTMMREEMDMSLTAKYGSADFTISLNGRSSSRFMLASQVEELIGDGGRAVGCLELAAFYGEDKDTVFLTATELDRISDFFDFHFTALSPITQTTKGEIAFVTESFAKDNGLAMGDSLELTVGETKKNYTIAGISGERFMASYDVMVDIVGVMRVLSASSPVLSAIGDSFKPSSVIYVDAEEGRVEECIDLVLGSDAFADKDITRALDQLGDENNIMTLTAPMKLSVFLTALLCAAVTFTCFYILSLERSDENLAFMAAGAKPGSLALMQYAEIFIYWLFGGCAGLAISALLVSTVGRLSGFEYAEGRLDIEGVIVSELGLLAVCFITVAIFTTLRRAVGPKKRKAHSGLIPLIAFGVLYVAFYIAVMLLSGNKSFVPYIISIALILPIGLMATPRILRSVTANVSARSDGALLSHYKIKYPVARYAIKNVYSVSILQNTARLVAVVSAVLLSLVFVIGGYFGASESTESILSGDYAVINASERCYEKLESCESVTSISRVYFSREQQQNNVFTSVVATDDLSVLDGSLGITALPEGGDAIISRGQAEMLSLEVGDTLTMNVGGRPIEVRISGVVKSGVQFVLIDSEHFGLSYNLLVANGTDGVEKDAVFEEISSKTALEMAAVMPLQQLLSESTRTPRILLRAALILLAVSTTFMAVGIADNLIESYRFRKEEFALYRLAGMSSGNIRRMKAAELLITFGAGLGIGIIIFLVHILATQKALLGIGNDLLSGIRDFFSNK